jgi:hypothetical protein
MKPVNRSAAEADRLEARFGLRLGALLDEGARRTPHDVSERLRIAREQAMARARASRLATAPAGVVMGRGGAAVMGGQPGWFFRVASVMPLLVLVGGLLLIDQWHERAQIEAAADVDVALLADDLPPDAYSDAGFVEFLKQDPQ